MKKQLKIFVLLTLIGFIVRAEEDTFMVEPDEGFVDSDNALPEGFGVLEAGIGQENRNINTEIANMFFQQRKEMEKELRNFKKDMIRKVMVMVMIFLRNELPKMVKGIVSGSVSSLKKTVSGWFGGYDGQQVVHPAAMNALVVADIPQQRIIQDEDHAGYISDIEDDIGYGSDTEEIVDNAFIDGDIQQQQSVQDEDDIEYDSDSEDNEVAKDIYYS